MVCNISAGISCSANEPRITNQRLHVERYHGERFGSDQPMLFCQDRDMIVKLLIALKANIFHLLRSVLTLYINHGYYHLTKHKIKYSNPSEMLKKNKQRHVFITSIFISKSRSTRCPIYFIQAAEKIKLFCHHFQFTQTWK